MRKLVALALVMCLALVPAGARAYQADGTARFGAALLREVASEPNPVISPLSAYIALSMAAAGAQGDTRAQIFGALGLSDDADVENAINAILALKDVQGSTNLNIANSAWLDDSFALSEEYAYALEQIYGAQAFCEDLSGDEAYNNINAWASDNTRGLIKQIREAPYDEDTKLLLINALYLYAEWQNKFTEESTYDQEFTLTSGDIVSTPFMHKTAHMLYNEAEDGAQAIILPYDDRKTAFMAVLPPEDMTLDVYLASADANRLFGLAQGAEYTRVTLSLPKIETENGFELRDALKTLGITDAFDPDKSDFSGISEDGEQLVLSSVIQKVVMRVREDGTEAAAVTVAEILAGSAPLVEEPIELNFNRPYLYMIYDTDTRATLFMGLVNDPSLFKFSNERRSGWKIDYGAPELFVSSADYAVANAATYSLSNAETGVDACGMHPLDMGDIAKVSLLGSGEVELYFELAPTEVSIRYWRAEYTGQAEYYESGFERAEYAFDRFTLPTDGAYIVEVVADYEYIDLSGKAYYAFMVGE